MNELTKPAEALDYYRGQIYWNDFEFVRDRINTKISGNPGVDWGNYLRSKFRVFDKCLMLNCGNGWVERDLYKTGLFNHVTGFDIGAPMITEAQVKAAELGMPADYEIADCNKWLPQQEAFDLAVNFAAMHHVAYINRLTHLTSRALKSPGKYVAFDYVGHHRNQYPWEVWSVVLELNASLPEQFRQPRIDYPHLKTMLHMDPTEAIHSELQIETLHRYFDVEEYKELGGPLAYHILYGNHALHDAQNTPEGKRCLQTIMEADDAFVQRHPEHNLFAFWIASPKASVDPDSLMIWHGEEERREAAVARNGGRYYPPTALEILTNEISDLRYEVSIRQLPRDTLREVAPPRSEIGLVAACRTAARNIASQLKRR